MEGSRLRAGDELLALPRFAFPIDRVQCYLRDSVAAYYYLTLSGSVVGLAVDPAFVPDAALASSDPANNSSNSSSSSSNNNSDSRNSSRSGDRAREEATRWTANVPIPRAKRCPRLLSSLPVCASLGLGIVHSVDLRRNRIVVLSPIPRDDLARVNTLVISTSPVPPELLSSVRHGRRRKV